MEKTVILKALVGSRAHGLHTEDSDYDYRGVYVVPTKDILSLGFKYKGSSWIEGDIDDTSYEIGHFLQLCTKANPAVFEILMSDTYTVSTKYIIELKQLFPYMYDPKDAFNAFAGYSKNQQKKLLEDKEGRRLKFGVAYVRTAMMLVDLLEKGMFSLRIDSEERKRKLQGIKEDIYSDGEILDLAEHYISYARSILPEVKNQQDLSIINDFLLSVRKDFW